MGIVFFVFSVVVGFAILIAVADAHGYEIVFRIEQKIEFDDDDDGDDDYNRIPTTPYEYYDSLN